MSNKQDINKAYVSPYDEFFYKFDATHDKTASQLKEIQKHQRIFALRDHATPEQAVVEIWEEF
jgi:hypothetical protein